MDLLNQVFAKEGTAGRARLCTAADRRERMIERYSKGQSVPSRHTAYKLALACGCNETEALELANECASEAKDTA